MCGNVKKCEVGGIVFEIPKNQFILAGVVCDSRVHHNMGSCQFLGEKYVYNCSC
jgi:hypothetical protein